MAAIRQNYHEESEAAINKQINMELYASYVYMSMVSYSFFVSFWTMDFFTLLKLLKYKTEFEVAQVLSNLRLR